jgi:hypothetical protein
MEFAAAPLRREQTAEVRSSGGLALMKNVVEGTWILGRLARGLYRRLSAARQPLTPFPGSCQYWEDRYNAEGNSGVGSYGKFAAFKAEVINAFVATRGVQSVIEFGCGDGNQLKLARYPMYAGYDVSEAAVRQCERLFAGDATKTFALMSQYRGEGADLALSLDVIYHLVEDRVFEDYMRTLVGAAHRYVIIYASNSDDNREYQGQHIKHRKFSAWLQRNALDWELLEHIPNRYPYRGDYTEGSFAEFFIYGRAKAK